MLASMMLASFHISANNVSVNEAKAIANTFMKSHYSNAPGSFKAPSTADLQLVHAESSRKVVGTNVFYAFNIKGGGFVIVSGDDMAIPVLGYCDHGKIDFNNLPGPLQCLLDGYKEEIEYVQTHPNDVIQPVRQSFRDASVIVEPMTRSTWAADWPYQSQCPVYNGKYSKVGCAGVAMAQMLYYWQYPVHCSSLPAYYASNISDTVPALPETVFDYDKMLLSYYDWDYDNQIAIFYDYTEDQAYEVAKLCRYAGQAAKINYSPSGSGMTEERKLQGMKVLGYNDKTKSLNRNYYSTERWDELLRIELDAGRPVMYAAYASASVGHAWIIDGYDSENFFHINMGWGGHADGWYVISSIKCTNRVGSYRFYNSKHTMFQGLEPPLFCEVNADGIGGNNNLIVLGDNLCPIAERVHLHTSYRTVEMSFSLMGADNAIVAASQPVYVTRHTYDQFSDITSSLTLPADLPEGRYDLQFCYRTEADGPLTAVLTANGALTVVGKFAKFNVPFNVGDVVKAIDTIITEDPQPQDINVADVVYLIDYILGR